MKKLNITGKMIPPVIIGTAHPSIYDNSRPNAPQPEKSCVFRLLDELWELGLTMYDCAAIYGEEILGEYLQTRKRHKDAVIVTKCAHPNEFRNRVTPYDMERDLMDSLAKLQTDYIDMYLLHRDDPSVPVSVIVDTLNRFHREGKIGAFGGSNWTVERIKEANEYAKQNNLLPFTISSPNYGLAHQMEDLWGWGSTTLTGPEHEKDREWYVKNDMPVFAYSALARGFFSGKFRSDEPEKAEIFLDDFAKKGYYYPENMERLRRAELLAEKYDCTVAMIAISWMVHQELNVFPILSGANPERFKEALEAVELTLTQEEIMSLDLR